MAIKTISPQAVFQLTQTGAIDLIDVRTPSEYGSVHATAARLVPLDRLDAKAFLAERNGQSGQPLYIICKSGGRSAQACEKFHAAGFTDVYSVEGGTTAWAAAGLPVERGAWSLPLDRQVQTIAGLVAFVGLLLGLAVNPWFFLMPGMVGFGLTLAGLTGFCPMGILLARMPWNQRGAAGTPSSCGCSAM